MSDADADQTRAWVENWGKVGPKLEEIRRRELRAFRHEDHVEIIDALLDMGVRFGTARTTSGLVQQQRLFRKARQ